MSIKSVRHWLKPQQDFLIRYRVGISDCLCAMRHDGFVWLADHMTIVTRITSQTCHKSILVTSDSGLKKFTVKEGVAAYTHFYENSVFQTQGGVFLFLYRFDSWNILMTILWWQRTVFCSKIESFRFEDEDEALCFRHNEIFKLFRLQLGRGDVGDYNNIVTPSLSRRWACPQWAKVWLGPRSRPRPRI